MHDGKLSINFYLRNLMTEERQRGIHEIVQIRGYVSIQGSQNNNCSKVLTLIGNSLAEPKPWSINPFPDFSLTPMHAFCNSSSSESSSSLSSRLVYPLPVMDKSQREVDTGRSMKNTGFVKRQTKKFRRHIHECAMASIKDHFGVEYDLPFSDDENGPVFPVREKSLLEYEKEFDKRIPDIEQGTYQIYPADKTIHTSGVASCIALITLGFDSNNRHIKTGIAHYDGIAPDLEEFFEKITASPVKEVRLYAYGGHDQGKDDEEENWAKVLKAKDMFESVSTVDWQMNPWKVEESYEENEPLLHNAGIDAFGLRAGIKNGEVLIADESTGIDNETETTFVDYQEVLAESTIRRTEMQNKPQSMEID